ncbi:unnamed protein product [Cochlearia groenlandica]
MQCSKFVEHQEINEKQQLNQKSKVKFKIMSMKVKPGVEYVPELMVGRELFVELFAELCVQLEHDYEDDENPSQMLSPKIFSFEISPSPARDVYKT